MGRFGIGLGLARARALASGGGGSGGFDISTQLLFQDDFVNCPANGNFIQAWRGVVSGTGAAIAPLSAGIEGHPGVARLSTGTTTSGSAILGAGNVSGGNNGSILSHATNAITIDAVLKVPNVPSSAQPFTATIGLSRLFNLTSDVYAAQIVWNGSASRWRLHTNINGGAAVNTDAASGPVADTFHHVQLVFTTALVTLNVDGVELATSSVNVPNGINRGGAPIIRMVKGGVGTTNRDLDVDLFKISQTVDARLS